MAGGPAYDSRDYRQQNGNSDCGEKEGIPFHAAGGIISFPIATLNRLALFDAPQGRTELGLSALQAEFESPDARRA